MRNAKTPLRTLGFLILTHTCVAQTHQNLAKQGESDKQETAKTTIKINDSQRIEVRAKIEPVKFTKTWNWQSNWDTLSKLQAAQETKEYAASVLRAFLPDVSVSVGDSLKVKPAVVELLKQLHKGATMDLHHNDDAEGGWAILQALNQQWAAIVFRVHGQFLLKDGRLTPSQFAGRLVIARRTGDVAYFRMHVPHYPLNFSVSRRMVAPLAGSPARKRSVHDSGCCPLIELVAGNNTAANRANWTAALSLKQAEFQLTQRFYPAWQIEWAPWDEALEKARRLKKPLHVVSAAGPFKDEAC